MLDSFAALQTARNELVADMERSIDLTRQNWIEEDDMPDSDWTVDAAIEDIKRDFESQWEMVLLRARSDGCPQADIDQAERELCF